MLRQLKLYIFVILTLCSPFAFSLDLQKPSQYKAHKHYVGWLMSEKLDGIRGIWNGKQLMTRTGRHIHAPKWFVKQLPPFALDGELWTKRQDNETVQSIVMDKVPSPQWQQIKYRIFEVPNAPGYFLKRLSKIQQWLNVNPSAFVSVLKQVKIKNKTHLNGYFNKLIKKGAEGIIIKNPNLSYFSGRSNNLVKRKMVYDMDAIVLDVIEGKGQNKGKMGSLKVKIASGKTFKIGTGYSHKQRSNPPKIGDTIRFKYYGLTAKGIPKHASFLNSRKD